MKVKDFLTEDKWIRGHKSRDRWGKPVSSDHLMGCHFDVLGAICKCYPPEERMRIMDLIKVHLPPPKLICLWNDEVSWEQIHAVLEKADV